jgi:glycosyltransferase involved in cell wall biosynthesis
VSHTKLSITLLIRSLGLGGSERQLADLATRLDPQLYQVVVLTFYPGGAIWDELRQNSAVQVESLNKRGRWDMFRFCWRLAAALRRHKPNVIHTYLVEPSILGLLIGRLVRSGAVVWAVRASDVNHSAYGRFHAVTFRISAWLSRFPNAIIANSAAGRAYHLKQRYSPRWFEVIPNGIDTTRYQPGPRESLRRRWIVEDSDILIGVVARLDPIKGHALLMEAVATLTTIYRGPKLRFICVGGGSVAYLSALQALSDRLGVSDEFVWAGEQLRMSSVYPAFDFVCSPSLSEGFSNIIGEAMASGVPCVVTNVGDSGLIVGDTGFVACQGDARALADAIARMARLSTDARAELGMAGRRRIVDLFGVDLMVERTAAVFRAVCALNPC